VHSAWGGVGRLSGIATMALVVVASCGPMAPAGHRSFETKLSGDSVTTGLRVVLFDGSGLVTSIEPSTAGPTGNPVDAVPGENAITIRWTGGDCDTRTTLTLDPAEIDFHVGITSDTTGQGCRLVGVLRRITVRLSQFQPSTRFRVSGP
jgi:hypothetical protein